MKDKYNYDNLFEGIFGKALLEQFLSVFDDENGTMRKFSEVLTKYGVKPSDVPKLFRELADNMGAEE